MPRARSPPPLPEREGRGHELSKSGRPSPVAWEASLGRGVLKVTTRFPQAVLSASFTNCSTLASNPLAPKQGGGHFKCVLFLCLEAGPQSYRIYNSRDNAHPPEALSLQKQLLFLPRNLSIYNLKGGFNACVSSCLVLEVKRRFDTCFFSPLCTGPSCFGILCWPFSLSCWLFFFWMWVIFKVFIEFVTILLLSYVLVFCPQGMSGLSSLTRDQTCFPPHWKAKS